VPSLAGLGGNARFAGRQQVDASPVFAVFRAAPIYRFGVAVGPKTLKLINHSDNFRTTYWIRLSVTG